MRRFGEPDTSLKAYGRLLWDTLIHDFGMKVVIGMALWVPVLCIWYHRLDALFLTMAVYVAGLTIHYLAWRHLVKKGTWWLM